jgi:outer membrane protein TolC
MIIKKSLVLLILPLVVAANENSALKDLSLERALALMKKENLELKISRLDEQMKAYDNQAAKGHQYGKLDLILKAARSNDAGNVFGFKLKSREASFGDFGFSDFMGAIGAGAQQANGDFGAFSQGLAQQGGNILALQPKDLNYPETRNHFQTTLSYMVPLYTGGKLSQYDKITSALHKMSKLDTSKLLNEKIFQVSKTFYDISLVNQYIINLNRIIENIRRLEEIVINMREEGFAKEIDQLEVKARKSEAQSMLSQAKFNKELAYQYLSFLLNHDVESIQYIDEMVPLPKIEKEEIQHNNIDIQKAELGLNITDMAIALQESNFLPEIGAMVEYGSADNNPFNDFIDKDFYTIGIQAKWNIFNGMIDKTNLDRAKVENMKVQEQVNLAKRGISLKVKKTVTNIKSKDADIKSLETQLQFARKVYENYQEQYKEGISSITDVLIKQSKELEVLLKLLTAKNDRNTKIFELKSIINTGETL